MAAHDLVHVDRPRYSANPSLSNMSKAKRDLLQKYLSGGVNRKAVSPLSIMRRAPGETTQTSFGQERLWFLEQLLPGSAVYNLPIAVRLSAPLDVSILELSLNEVVRRHEVLRTTFATVDGQPKPVIASSLRLTITVVDLRNYPQRERETIASRLTNAESLRPFDLSTGPLLRVSLVNLDDVSQILLVTTHHIISDGWSTAVFFRELSLLYVAFSKREQSPLAELPIQYADYAAWQREWLQGPVFEKQLSYWRKKLSGNLPVLELPTDRPRPPMQTHRGARESLLLSRNLTESIAALARRDGATLFMTLLAAFKILLSRLTGLEDIIVGSPITSRPQRETEGLIGFFLNNLVLRTELSGNPSFRDVLARVRETALEAYANQDVPFGKLVDSLNPDRNLCRTPIFQVYFNLLNFSERLQLPGLAMSDIAFVDAWSQSDSPYSQFDITLYVAERNDTLQLILVYNADIFGSERMAAMLEQFQRLLEQMVITPEAPVCNYLMPAKLRTQRSALRRSKNELADVEEVICNHPSIKQTKVVEVDHAPGEERLVAYVVLSEEVETINNDLRRLVKQQLPDYLIPSEFVILDELPSSANGELDQSSLPATDGKQFGKNDFVPPRTELEQLLAKVWEKVLEVRPIGVKDNFFDLGGQSLLAVFLFAQIEKLCGKKLPLTTLFQAPTVEQLAVLLNEEQWSPSWSSLVPIQPTGSRPPLFCLHLALGHVLFYRDLASRLGLDQPVYAFRPQGLDGERLRHTRIEEMASHYIKEMRALQPEGPYFLCGSSFGGLIAFEMARQLSVQAQEVGLLALFDTYAPSLPELSNEGRTLRHKVHRIVQRADLHLGNFKLLSPEEKVKYLHEKAVRVNGRVKGSLKKWTEKGFKLIPYTWSKSNGHSVRSEYELRVESIGRLKRDYKPQLYSGCVTLFRASKRPAGYYDNPDLGWAEFAAGGVEVHEIPGYHGSIVTEPRVRVLAERLQACLSRPTIDRPKS